MKRYTIVLNSSLALLLLWAPHAANGEPASPKLEKITIQLKWKHQFQFAGYYAAIKKGFYAEEGLSVVLRERNLGIDHIDEVVAGRAQYGVADSGLLLSRLQGKPVVLLAQIFQHSPLVFLTLQSSGLRTPYDLAGKSAMIPEEVHKYPSLSALLLKAHGGLDKLRLVEETFRNQDLIDGKVDAMVAYATDQPFWFQERGSPVNVIDPRDHGIDFYGDNLYTSETEIREHPERVAAVIRATLKGWDYALANKEELIDLIQRSYNPQKFSSSHLAFEAKHTEAMIVPRFVEIGHYELSRFRKIAETYVNLGLCKQAEVPRQFFYDRTERRTVLTSEERAWLSNHPVITFSVDDSYPPLNFRGRDGQLTGITFDYLDLIAGKLGVRVKYEAGKWNDVLGKALAHETDGIVNASVTEERKAKLDFTQPYASHDRAIFAAQDASAIASLTEIEGWTIAAKTGTSEIPLLRQRMPKLQFEVTENELDALRRVIERRAFGAAMSLPVGTYLVRKHQLTGLRPLYVFTDERVGQARIGVRNDAPLLRSSLDRAIAAITTEERLQIQRKWGLIQDVQEEGTPPLITTAPEGGLTRTAIWIAGIMALLSGVMWLLIRLAGDRLPVGLQTSGSQAAWILAASMFLTVIVTAAWWGLHRMERQARASAGEMLSVVLQTTQGAARAWFSGEKDHLGMFARQPEVIANVRQLLKVPRTRDALLASPAQGALRHFLKRMGEQHYHRGVFIIAPDLINVGSMRDANIGMRNLIAEQRPVLLQRAFSGQTVFVPPIRSDVPLADASGQEREAAPTMLIATPVKSREGGVIAVMTLRYDPGRVLTGMCQAGRSGQTGETYAFDRSGRMLSQSRFLDELVRTEIAPQGEDTILGFRLGDPGGNLLEGYRPSIPRDRQPLTRMAASATAGQSGVDVEGYRDYRGVRVLGAWLWDLELQIGLTTEIDELEALTSHRGNRVAVLSVLGLVALLTAALVGFLVLSGERANRALRQARDEWERVAEERTAELRKLSLATEASPSSVAVTDREGTIEYVNPRFTEVTGYTADEVVGQNHRILKSGVQSAEVYVDLWQTITAGDTWRGELCNRRKNGELFWESLSISPIVDAEGAITHFVAVKEDITSRRQMEEEIRRSEIRFRTIFEGSNDAIMLLTQEGFFDCNARTLEMFGFETREEFTAVHPADVSPPQQPDGRDSMEAAQSWIETAFREGHCRFEWMHRRTSGEDFPVEVLLSAFQYGEETVLEATVRDIAERKQAEEAMRTSEAFLQSTLDALSAHIAVLDEDGTILTVNEPWRRFAADNGYCHDDCGVGVNYLEQCRAVVGPERSEARDVAEGIRQVIDGERNSFKLSYACHSPDQKRWFTMHVTQLHDRDGNRVVVAHENVTELQQAEQELREAMEAAETANRAKSIFLANMSHEIRTPLNAILGFSQLMQRDSSLVPGQRENLNTINRSGEHLLALINDVLEMSKIEAGRVELVPETFDLKAMVHDMESMFQIRARSAGLKLDSEVSPNVPQFVHGDQGKIRQVLINLLSNAVKFTREGGAELLVNVETAPPGYRLIIQVRDTGIGIAADELSRVFDQFEQTNAGLKSQGGTGLGLAISREYARLMSGDITVASEPGKGSTFQFECDLREGQEGEVTERIDERRVVALATGSPDFKVLIVDDIEQNRLLLNRLLKHVGFQVREAADGQEALQIFRDWSPDIVLMDMAMPVMDGYEATRRIKAMDRGSETPVVAVTASALDEARREVAEAGADDFISKPFREAELFEALSRHLDVQYAYDMCDSETSASESGSTMATIKLDRLPKALVEEMRAAVDQADLDQLLECISAVEAHDEHVASHLRQLAEAFDYEVLETLLRGDA